MTDLLTILLAALGTWLLRASFIVFVSGGARFIVAERLLSDVRPAALAALVTTALSGGASGGLALPELTGAGAAALAAWRTRNMLLTLAVSFVALASTEIVAAAIS
jgi:branched-subunit amino acid transport protein